jgi:hypothetical protein
VYVVLGIGSKVLPDNTETCRINTVNINVHFVGANKKVYDDRRMQEMEFFVEHVLFFEVGWE